MRKEELGTVPNEEEFASFKQALKDLKEGYEAVSYTHLTLPTIYSV